MSNLSCPDRHYLVDAHIDLRPKEERILVEIDFGDGIEKVYSEEFAVIEVTEVLS